MSKHLEPDIEFVVIQLRHELERIALSQFDLKELRPFGYRTIAEEAELRERAAEFRVRARELPDTSSRIDTPNGAVHIAERDLFLRYCEDTEQKLQPANAGFVAAVAYMRCRRRATAERFAPLEYVPDSRHRGDHVALALSRIVGFWHQENRISEAETFHRRASDCHEQMRQFLLTDVERPSALTSLLDEDSSPYIQTIRRALSAFAAIAGVTDIHSDRKFWESLVGRRAADPRTGKPIWELDALNRKRQAILSTREVLFGAIEDNEEIERLVPDGEGGAPRAKLARIRAQRRRFETSFAKSHEVSGQALRTIPFG